MRAMKILVVDDERAVRESLRRALELEGYEVELAGDGEEALERLTDVSLADAVILDVLMPGIDGLEVCRRLRAEGNEVPVLMLTARAEVDSRVAGLDAGADDYLPKPFALAELLARLRALLRRAANGDEPSDVLRFADVELDLGTREVFRGDLAIELTRTEFSLLELFLRNPRQVLTRSVISSVCGATTSGTRRTRSTSTSATFDGRRRTEGRGASSTPCAASGTHFASDDVQGTHRGLGRGCGRAHGRRGVDLALPRRT